ncbi:hypothetical protein [Nocardioides litoris]|uniref:hypothetical protein n=1 Tax=Nocardioides litoris TaxID=1926648 RepID=UPI0011209795|nr:hypothetical protein [Nocardioides litoris]
MTLLAVDAGPTEVTASLGDARAARTLVPAAPHPGWAEIRAEDVWQAVLATVREVVAAGVVPTRVALSGDPATCALWDEETLGSPRPVITADDRRTGSADLGPRLAWLAEHEPHTWALVEQGRYAVGPVVSYVLARATRGLEHLLDPAGAGATGLLDPATGAWAPPPGVPLDALPDLAAGPELTGVTTDPGTFDGLALPVVRLAPTS